MSTNPQAFDFDLLIVGGGLVGAALAVAVGRSTSHRVGLIESHRINTASGNGHFDDRSVAIAHGSRLVFAQLGLDALFESQAEPIFTIHVSERGQFGATRLNAAEEQVPALGYVIENRALGAALFEQLNNCTNVTLLDGTRVLDLNQNKERAALTVGSSAGERTLTAQLVVAADGAQSQLRDLVGIGAREHDYRQSAIIANVCCSLGHRNIAYERFTDSGPLALLPLRDDRYSLVMTVWSDELEDVMGLDDDAFLNRLQRRFGRRAGRFERVGARASFPLNRVSALSDSAGRTVLMGNAMHNLHPVSGQGFNLAIRDVGLLTELLAAQPELELASADLLQEFSRRRVDDHRRVERFTDTLARLFTLPFTGAGHLRGAGLIATDVVPFLRRSLARQSMGMGGRLPLIKSQSEARQLP
ncbi:MAG: 2-octaprenyl-6-methoxyphenyl hydroxylase [Pseudomonadota bacterium]